MISSGIDETPIRARAWLKQMVDTPGSIVHDSFPTIEDTEAIPNPLNLEEDDNPFPCLAVLHAGWRQIEEEAHLPIGEVGIENRLKLLVTKLLGENEAPGLAIRSLQAKLVALFIQERYHRPPVDHTAPADSTRQFWRPQDISDTGIQLFKVTATSADPQDPLPFGKGILLERAAVFVTCQGSARSI